MNNIDILEEPKDILFEIDMQLYDEFNDKFCEIEENLGTVYSYKDLEDLKKAESDTERTLLRQAISTLIAENKELKETVEKRDNKIYELLDRSINALKLINKEEVKQDYIPKSKVEEIIHNNKPHIAQEKLQSLLGKE